MASNLTYKANAARKVAGSAGPSVSVTNKPSSRDGLGFRALRLVRLVLLWIYVLMPLSLLTMFRMPELMVVVKSNLQFAAAGVLVLLLSAWRCRFHTFLAILVGAIAVLTSQADAHLWTPPLGTSMDGRVAVVTGGNSGLGLAMAKELASLGAHVVVTCRSAARCEPALADIRNYANNSAVVESAVLSLTSLRSAAELAAHLRERHPKIDLLVNNAGGTPLVELTDDGLENGFGGMHLAHMALTLGLLPSLQSAAATRKQPSRVVMVSSHGGVASASGDFGPAFDDSFMLGDGEGDLRGERTRGGSFLSDLQAYGRAKLANSLFAFELTRRGASSGVISNALHTGGVHTGAPDATFRQLLGWAPGMEWLLSDIYLPAFWRTPKQGASTLLFAALALEPEQIRQGGEFVDGMCQPSLQSDSGDMKALRDADKKWSRRLWDVSSRLIKRSPASPVLEHSF